MLFSILAGYPGGGRMYDTMPIRYYCLYVVNNVYGTVKDSESWVVTFTTRKQQRKVRFLSMTKPLEFILINIPGRLPKQSGNHYIVVKTESLSKLTEAIQAIKAAATAVVTVFLYHSVSNFSIPTKVPAEIGPESVSKCFTAIWVQLGMKANTTTENHPQAYRHVELIDWTIVFRLRENGSEHRKNWFVFALLLTHANNAEVYWAAKLPTFSLGYTRKSPGPAKICAPITADTIHASSARSQRFPLLHKAMLR